jgi:hypothetical protein
MQSRWITKLSTDLGLVEHIQDWGICNSDPRRIREFIAYYMRNRCDDAWESEALAALIFQSAEEAVEEGLLTDQDKGEILDWVARKATEFPATLKYWKALDAAEWRVAALLNTQNA